MISYLRRKVTNLLSFISSSKRKRARKKAMGRSSASDFDVNPRIQTEEVRHVPEKKSKTEEIMIKAGEKIKAQESKTEEIMIKAGEKIKAEESKTEIMIKAEEEIKAEESKTEIKAQEIKIEESKTEIKTEIKTEEIKPEESKTEIKTGESKSEIKAGESKTEIKTGESKTEIKTGESKTEIKAGESKTEIKAGGSKTEIKAGESKTEEIKTGESKSEIKAGESKTEIKAGESKTEIKIGENKTEIKIGESKTEIKAGESKTEIKTGESKTGIKAGDSKTEIKTGESKTEIKAGESKIEIKAGESKTEEIKAEEKEGQTAEGKDGVLIKEKESNQAKAVQQVVKTKEERVTADTNKPLRSADKNVYIIPYNSIEECNYMLQMYKEMHYDVLPPLMIKKESLTRRIARTYEEERAYRIYIGDIVNWRKLTSSSLKELKNTHSRSKKQKPKIKRTEAMKMLTFEFEKKLIVDKSPEMEKCHIAIEECSRRRQQLITQLFMK